MAMLYTSQCCLTRVALPLVALHVLPYVSVEDNTMLQPCCLSAQEVFQPILKAHVYTYTGIVYAQYTTPADNTYLAAPGVECLTITTCHHLFMPHTCSKFHVNRDLLDRCVYCSGAGVLFINYVYKHTYIFPCYCIHTHINTLIHPCTE